MKKLTLAILLLSFGLGSSPAQSPGEPNEGSRLRLNPDGTRSFAWWGRSGRTYFLKTSEDLVHWSYLPMIQSGAGQAISWSLTTTAPKSFFKLQYTDQPTSNPQTADFDGDHIGNADELRIGTDPFVADLTDGGGTDPGNGLPDAWERAYGLSTSADGNADSDGDGISDYDEYLLGLNPSSAYTNGGGPGGAGGTSDGDLDSDGDGKKNNEDQYPADERRTEDIAPLNYAILDVSKNVMPADKDVDQIAMGADGRVAFSWWDGNETYKVAKWKDGQLEPGSPKVTATKLYFDWGPGNTAVVALKKDDEAQRLINANGEVAAIGYVSGNASTGADWVLALWPYGTEQVDERNTAASIDEVPERYSMQSGRVLLDSGLLIGESDYDMNPAYTPKTGIGQATSTGSYMAMNLTLEDVIPNIPSGQEPQGSLICSAVSQSGKIAVSLNGYASSQGPSFQEVGIGESGSYQKIAGAVDDILGFIPVINDSKDFILADSSEGKFLFYKAAAKVDKLENLLPEKYREQIRWEGPAQAVPMMGAGGGSGSAASSARMIALANSGKLVLEAQCLEGRGRGEWVTRTFVSDKDPTAGATSNLRTLQQLHFPENYQVALKGGPQGLTDQGLLAAFVKKTKELNLDGTYTLIPEAQQKDKPAPLVPINVTIKKKTDTEAPKDGMVAKVGDVIEFKLSDIPPENFPVPAANIKWFYKQLKADGTYTDWADIGSDARGVKFEHTYTTGGIFEIKCEMTVGSQTITTNFERKMDNRMAKHDPDDGSEPVPEGMKKGDLDAIGICDTQKQIDIRYQAKINVNSAAYANSVDISPVGTGNHCNIFVAHKAGDAGATVPWFNGGIIPPYYPPVANQWAGVPAHQAGHPELEQPEYESKMTGWPLLPSDSYPQPGMIAGEGWYTWATGHCGIVDYDGQWISAGPAKVNRFANFIEYRTHSLTGRLPAGKRKYTGN